jgi:hypothetical protein
MRVSLSWVLKIEADAVAFKPATGSNPRDSGA